MGNTGASVTYMILLNKNVLTKKAGYKLVWNNPFYIIAVYLITADLTEMRLK